MRAAELQAEGVEGGDGQLLRGCLAHFARHALAHFRCSRDRERQREHLQDVRGLFIFNSVLDVCNCVERDQ